MKRIEFPTDDPAVRLVRLVRRFRNAKKRARYWSGTPSFSPWARAKAANSGRMDEQYELAMCDQQSLAGLIADLGGKALVRDYKAEFRKRWSRIHNAPPACPTCFGLREVIRKSKTGNRTYSVKCPDCTSNSVLSEPSS